MLTQCPAIPAVFLLDAGAGQQPYLSRTSNLKRRLERLLRPVHGPSRMLNLRGIARALRYWPATSALAASLTLWEQARSHYPDRHRRMLRLRLPYYVVLLMEDRFPRAVVSREPGPPEMAYGPFATRAAAEEFLAPLLDLVQLRRCEESLEPHPEHPGCIYGEMAMCLRPCQAMVDDRTYRSEARTLLAVLATRGESLREQLQRERDSASEDMDFERAARVHKRLTKLSGAFPASARWTGLLASLHGVAVTLGPSPDVALLWPMTAGHLQQPLAISGANLDAEPLRGALRSRLLQPLVHPSSTQQELLAIFGKWLRSTWCDGLWVEVNDGGELPVRKLRNAIRRMTTTILPEQQETAESEETQDAAGNL
jgi:hypothetical protein